MDTAHAIEELIEATRGLADLVDRMAPRRPILEERLLNLIRTTKYTWKCDPGTSRVTADLAADYHVSLIPGNNTTAVVISKRRAGDTRGLTTSVIPELYVSLDVWYWAYNRALRDDGLTLDEVLSGRTEVADTIPQEAISDLVKSGFVKAARAIDEEMDVEADAGAEPGWTQADIRARAATAERRANNEGVEENATAIEEIRATLIRCQNAYDAGDCGDEG